MPQEASDQASDLRLNSWETLRCAIARVQNIEPHEEQERYTRLFVIIVMQALIGTLEHKSSTLCD